MSIAGFLRRIAAILYDSLLLIAVLFAATAVILPLNNGEAFASNNLFYLTYLFIVSFLYFGWFWTHGGQTLGMAAWKLKVLTQQHQPISWKFALVRFLTAILSWALFGLGFLWILFDRNKQSWHDRISQTAIFFDPLKFKKTT